MFAKREMQAIRALLVSDNGVNIDTIVNDLTCTKEDKVDKEEFALKVALQLSGRLPEFVEHDAYINEYSTIYRVKVLAESLLNNECKILMAEKFRKNDKDHFVKCADFEPYEKTTETRRLSEKADNELYATDPDVKVDVEV